MFLKWPEPPKCPSRQELLTPVINSILYDFTYEGYEAPLHSYQTVLGVDPKQDLVVIAFSLGEEHAKRVYSYKPAYTKAKELFDSGITPEQYEKWYRDFEKIEPREPNRRTPIRTIKS